ncbi:type II toxin-antitoxin system RelE/ParE family toxin [Candidatus Parcubacteria bacterium]|nr:MAG: type II toxin-antitoxin system RelE/ParE family toxin [Candidatus Parcubacteria bacterium]
MAGWRFFITEPGEFDLDKLDRQIRARILTKLKWLMDNFEGIIPLPLDHKFKGFFKLRVGDWRIIYEVKNKEKLITVHYIGRRDDIYK